MKGIANRQKTIVKPRESWEKSKLVLKNFQ